MKKILALVLALVMVLAMLAGCSGKEDDVAGQITPVEQETEASSQITPAEDPEAEEPAEENAGALGRIEGGIYTNTYAGFGCELDANWVYYSADELQTLPADVSELFADTELGENAANYTQISDMMAENANDMTSMNVLYTKMGMQERLLFATLSEEDTIDLTLDQKDQMIAAYEQSGMENVTMEKVKVTFLGEEHTAAKTHATIQGIDYYILQIIDYQCGSYGVTLTVSSFMEDKTEDLLGLFFKA